MPPASEFGESVWAEHESAIRRFENAWASGRPALAAHVPAGTRDRDRLTAELIQIDLEFRFRAGERPRVEEYLPHFPDPPAADVLAELVAGELAQRDRFGPPSSPDELRQRFPQLADRLDTLLASGFHRDRTRTRAGSAGRWVTAKPDLPGYTVGEQLGRGGMGVVYRARQETPARTVAVKTLLAMPNDRTAARFRREAEAMARLDHPHIVPVYEVGEWSIGGDRLPFFTMKWYAGGSMDTAPCGPGTDLHAHARTVETVARAVHHAHQRGVLHRDLKPSNILLDADGKPAVCDFGLAGRFDPDDPAPLSESVVGTPAYMAPEQARDPSGVTTATDVYGLGAILYFTLTARPPVNAPTALAAFHHLGGPPERPSAVNPAVHRDLETVCLKCLEADPRNRYPTAEAVAEDLARWRAGRSISARPPGFAERLWRAVRRHPVVAALSLATAAAVVFALVTLSVSVRRIREKEAETAAALDRERQALYLERVAAVGRLYQMNHLEPAWHALAGCPPELRGWEWDYLDRVRRTGGGNVLRHDDAVVGVALLADGRAATADRAGLVRVWVADGRATVLAATGTALRSHPTTPLLAVRDDRGVSVQDVDRDREVFRTAAAGRWFDFSPDGATLAVADGKTIHLFDTHGWRAVGTLEGHADTVWGGVFTANGTTLYTSSTDKTVGVWDVASRRRRAEWNRDGAVYTLRLTQDQGVLVEMSAVGVATTDVRNGLPQRIGLTANQRPVLLPTAEFGQYIVPAVSGELLLRGLGSNEPKRAYRGHVGAIHAIATSRDGRRMLTGGEDATARVWDLTASPDHDDLLAPRFRPGSVALSADGAKAVIAHRQLNPTRDTDLPVLDARTGRELFTVPGQGDAVFDPLGRWLAAGRHDGAVVIRDAADGRDKAAVPGWERAPKVLAFRPDGRRLLAVGLQNQLKVWDTDGWAELDRVLAAGEMTAAVAWSPDNFRLAVAVETEVRLLDPSFAVVCRFTTRHTPVSLAFSPDGRSLAVAGRGRSLELFDTATGVRRLEFVGNPAVANGLAFHPSGTRLATAGGDGVVRVWETGTGKELLALGSGGNDLLGVAWSADGRHLYAVGPSLRRWSAAD